MSQDPPKRRGPLLIEIAPTTASDRAPVPPRLDIRPPKDGPAATAAAGDDHPSLSGAKAGPEETGPQQANPDTGPQRGDGRDRRPPRHPSHGAGATAQPSPADAPLIQDGLPGALPHPRAMMLVTRLAGRRPSWVTRLFLNTGAALLTFLLSVAALRFLSQLLTSYPLLGWVGIALFAAFSLAALAMGWREYRAWSRFATIDHIRRGAGQALAAGDVMAARQVSDRLAALYADRPELAAARALLARHRDEAFDAQSLLAQAEAELLADLDQQARREVEAAARIVAAATALIPLALVDVIAALAANLRMIRRLAEIYGGRAGSVGGWRLARTVFTHLIATGAVAAGDDLIQTVAGGGLLSRLSRRFGEGVVNGALTARVGIAAIEVCRPLPFIHQRKPSVGGLISRGLKGLFGSDEAPPKAAAKTATKTPPAEK